MGSFQAGNVGNVIPDRAELRLSLRSFDPEVRRKLRTGVERMTPVVKAAFGEAARFESAMAPGVSTSEDFAAYMETGTPSPTRGSVAARAVGADGRSGALEGRTQFKRPGKQRNVYSNATARR